MNVTQFEHLIEEHGLHHIFTIASQLRFLVSLHVEQQFGMSSLCDTLAFGRDEFESMTKKQAQFHIDACKSRMEQAAKTKTPAWLYYPEHRAQQSIVACTPHKKRRTHASTPALATTINYPAH